ncbi:hypothetical protein ACTU3I_07040 [Microbacterium sp. RD1]|uniref:hypothetical protein n=1 Tax=Microbacterium sp. RD1 TaxID=3457313 RepID=UPI003FA5CBBF
MTAACAGVMAAGGCCLAQSRWRARALAVVMAVACLPFLPATLRMAAGLLLLSLAMVLSVGVRRLTPRERALDVHRAVGGALMAGMLLVGGHDFAAGSTAHVHGAALSPHLLLAAGAIAYLGWSVTALTRRAHRPVGAAARVELVGMGAMFALLVAAMALG